MTRRRSAARDDVRLIPGYHSPQLDVDVRLNTNESPLPPPAGWYDELASQLSRLSVNRYPDREANELREAIARLHGVDRASVFCANGSNEVIQTLLLAFGGSARTAVTFEPTYALHSHIARVTGTNVASGQRDDDFVLPAAELEVYAPNADVLFLCSPNNPTGVVESPDLVHRAIEVARGLVVVDEAYGQFASWSAQQLLHDEGSLVVLRTFSKTWAMAGVRLGYAIAAPWLIEQLWKAALPYHLSMLTQQAGLLALRHEPEMRERVAMLVHERERVDAALGLLPVRRWPSHANFILFRPNDVSGQLIWERLVERSVLVRNCNTWPGLEGCLRVTIGVPDENDRFLTALEEALQ